MGVRLARRVGPRPAVPRKALVKFNVLGPLEVSAAERPLAIGGSRARAVLALLLLDANRVVPAERLMDAVWPELARERAAANLQVRLSELRKALRTVGESERLETRAPGYVLRVEPDELDLTQFEQLVAGGRTLADGDPETASGCSIRRCRCGAVPRSPTSTASASRTPSRHGSRRSGSAHSNRESTRSWRAAATPRRSASSSR